MTFERICIAAFWWFAIAFTIAVWVAVWALAGALWPYNAYAQIEGRNVDTALVLALDHSSSVTAEEWKLQLNGYADALRSDTVAWSVQSGKNRRIAVYIFEWGGPADKRVIVPWTILDGQNGLSQLAAAMENYQLLRPFDSTSISAAMAHAEFAFLASPYIANRMVLDISGDGKNNQGFDPAIARARLLDMGVVINGLPIIAEEADLGTYYQNNVIGGRGSFMIAAQGFEDFAQAIQRKLEQELAFFSPISGARP